ncbi:MAG: hypothetical protein AAB416_01735, partial [Patescibacteria group bacterium]
MRLTGGDEWVLIGVIWWCSFVLCASLAYITAGITLATSLLALIVSGVGAVTVGTRYAFSQQTHAQREGVFGTSAIVVLAACIDLFLLSLFFMVRTDEMLRTPWVFPVSIGAFVLFGLSTATLLIGRHAPRIVFTPVLILHCFTAFGVALISFRYGFGYDPIIHQTAERYVFAHGRILPLQPYYIGQYAVVAALSFLTSLP